MVTRELCKHWTVSAQLCDLASLYLLLASHLFRLFPSPRKTSCHVLGPRQEYLSPRLSVSMYSNKKRNIARQTRNGIRVTHPDPLVRSVKMLSMVVACSHICWSVLGDQHSHNYSYVPSNAVVILIAGNGTSKY